jgi:hypothetical protein
MLCVMCVVEGSGRAPLRRLDSLVTSETQVGAWAACGAP